MASPSLIQRPISALASVSIAMRSLIAEESEELKEMMTLQDEINGIFYAGSEQADCGKCKAGEGSRGLCL